MKSKAKSFQEDPDAVSSQNTVDFKLDLWHAVAPFASAVLLDPISGAGQAIISGVLPGKTGLPVSVEKTGYAGTKAERTTELLPKWTALSMSAHNVAVNLRAADHVPTATCYSWPLVQHVEIRLWGNNSIQALEVVTAS